MALFREVYSETETNTNQAAGTTQQFGRTASNDANRRKYGSMNSLLITTSTDNTLTVTLDGNEVGRFTNSSFSIKPEEGIYFNFIDIKNEGVDQVDAGLIRIRYARAERIGS